MSDRRVRAALVIVLAIMLRAEAAVADPKISGNYSVAVHQDFVGSDVRLVVERGIERAFRDRFQNVSFQQSNGDEAYDATIVLSIHEVRRPNHRGSVTGFNRYFDRRIVCDYRMERSGKPAITHMQAATVGTWFDYATITSNARSAGLRVIDSIQRDLR